MIKILKPFENCKEPNGSWICYPYNPQLLYRVHFGMVILRTPKEKKLYKVICQHDDGEVE